MIRLVSQKLFPFLVDRGTWIASLKQGRVADAARLTLDEDLSRVGSHCIAERLVALSPSSRGESRAEPDANGRLGPLSTHSFHLLLCIDVVVLHNAAMEA